MAAIAYPMTDPWVGDRPIRPDQMDARVCRLETGRLRPGARVYRRRRAVALMALVAVALVAVTGIRLARAAAGGGALTAAGSVRAVAGTNVHHGAGTDHRTNTSATITGSVYIVQPGDSLWSIVEATNRGGDPRPEVDRLAAALDARPLEPGQRIQLPGRD